MKNVYSLVSARTCHMETYVVVIIIPGTRLNLTDDLIRELINCVIDKLIKVGVFLFWLSQKIRMPFCGDYGNSMVLFEGP